MLINCSYRGMESNSHYFLERLEERLGLSCEYYQLMKTADREAILQHFEETQAVVLGMPLYVDSAPAQVVEWMQKMYENKKTGVFCPVYVIVNMGFYDSRQIHILLRIVKNWCGKMGLVYGGGLAVGAGEMLGGMKNVPLDKGPNKALGEGMAKMAEAVSQRRTFDDIYVEPTGFPRFLYKLAADSGWTSMAKKNGLKKSDLKAGRV